MSFTDNITFYIENYVLVPSSFANAGDTGLTTGKAYVAIRVEDIDDLTEAEAAETAGSSSFRQLVHALVKQFYTEIQEVTAADRPTKLTIAKSVQGDGSGNASETHYVTSVQGIDGAVISE